MEELTRNTSASGIYRPKPLPKIPQNKASISQVQGHQIQTISSEQLQKLDQAIIKIVQEMKKGGTQNNIESLKNNEKQLNKLIMVLEKEISRSGGDAALSARLETVKKISLIVNERLTPKKASPPPVPDRLNRPKLSTSDVSTPSLAKNSEPIKKTSDGFGLNKPTLARKPGGPLNIDRSNLAKTEETQKALAKAAETQKTMSTILSSMTSYSKLTPDQANKAEQDGIFNSDALLSTYMVLCSSTELFQSINNCLLNPTIPDSKKVELLKLASSWCTSHAHLSEAKNNPGLGSEFAKILANANRSPSKAIQLAGQELNAAHKSLIDTKVRTTDELRIESQNKVGIESKNTKGPTIDQVKSGNLKAGSKEYKNYVEQAGKDLSTLFSNIRKSADVTEFMVDFAKPNSAVIAPNLSKENEMINIIGASISAQILQAGVDKEGKVHPQRIARVANFYLDLAEQAIKNGDTQTAFAIAQGINYVSNTSRVVENVLDKKSLEKYNKLGALCSPFNNFKNLRIFSEKNSPIAMLASKDVIFTHEGNPSYKNGKINLEKIQIFNKITTPMIEEKAKLDKSADAPIETAIISNLMATQPLDEKKSEELSNIIRPPRIARSRNN